MNQALTLKQGTLGSATTTVITTLLEMKRSREWTLVLHFLELAFGRNLVYSILSDVCSGLNTPFCLIYPLPVSVAMTLYAAAAAF